LCKAPKSSSHTHHAPFHPFSSFTQTCFANSGMAQGPLKPIIKSHIKQPQRHYLSVRPFSPNQPSSFLFSPFAESNLVITPPSQHRSRFQDSCCCPNVYYSFVPVSFYHPSSFSFLLFSFFHSYHSFFFLFLQASRSMVIRCGTEPQMMPSFRHTSRMCYTLPTSLLTALFVCL
jgi:hypothetical protein